MPVPLGPLSLWALALSMSMCISSTSMGICPKACTASVWNRMPCFLAICPISLIGCMVPISLLANMTLISTVSGRMASFRASGSRIPSLSTSR